MSDDILILVATMSGTAEMVADEVADRFEDEGASAKIVRMENASVEMVASASKIIICSSTYGKGDVPDNGRALYEALGSKRPDLSGIEYGVIALGDSQYPKTFCFGGKKFDELFTELGAHRVCEPFRHDARSTVYVEEAGADWAEQWLGLIDL